MSSDPFDVELEDPELLAEVELTASLIVAANQSDGPAGRRDRPPARPALSVGARAPAAPSACPAGGGLPSRWSGRVRGIA